MNADILKMPIFYAFSSIAVGVALYLLSTWTGWGNGAAGDLRDFGKSLVGGGVIAVLVLVKQNQVEAKVDSAATTAARVEGKMDVAHDMIATNTQVTAEAADAAKVAAVKADVAAGAAAAARERV